MRTECRRNKMMVKTWWLIATLAASSPPLSLFSGHRSKRSILQGRICRKALVNATVGRCWSWCIWTGKVQPLASVAACQHCSGYHPDCIQKFPARVLSIHVANVLIRSSAAQGRSTSVASIAPNGVLNCLEQASCLHFDWKEASSWPTQGLWKWRYQGFITLKKGWNKDQDITNNWGEVQLKGSLLSRGVQRAFQLFVADKFSIGHAFLLSTTDGFQSRTGISWSLNQAALLMETRFALPSSQGSCILEQASCLLLLWLLSGLESSTSYS